MAKKQDRKIQVAIRPDVCDALDQWRRNNDEPDRVTVVESLLLYLLANHSADTMSTLIKNRRLWITARENEAQAQEAES